MLNYAVLSKKPAVFRNFSGLKLTEFDALTLKLNEKYPAFEQKRLAREDRKRQIGAGHPFTLSLADRFLMLLMYSRLYVSSTLLAYLFNLTQTNVLKDIRKLEPLVCEVLPLPKKLHEKVGRLQTLDEVEEIFPGFKASWTRPSRRSQDQKTSVSGRPIIAARRRNTRSKHRLR
jgi:hypothetical protein